MPKIGKQMISETTVALVSRVELRTRSRMLAYQWIASRIGRSSRWVRGLAAGTVRRVDSEVSGAISRLLIQELEKEHGRLSAELALARQCGARLDSEQIGEIEAHLSRVAALLAGRLN